MQVFTTQDQEYQPDHHLEKQRSAYLNNFHSLCHSFYYFEKPLIAGFILILFDRAQKNPNDHSISLIPDDTSMFPNEFKDIDPRNNPELNQWIEKIGFNTSNSPHYGYMLFPQDYVLYQKIKNDVRTQFHREKAKERMDRFYTTVSTLAERRHFAQSSNTNRSLSSFLSKYGSYLGAYPILLGLQRLIRARIETPNKLIAWKLEIHAFTERGDDEFVKDTITFLLDMGCWPDREDILSQQPTLSSSAPLLEDPSLLWHLDSSISTISLIRSELKLCLHPWYRKAVHASRPTGTMIESDTTVPSPRGLTTYVWFCIYKLFHFFIH